MLTAARMGVDFAMATPPSFGPNPEVVTQARDLAAQTGAALTITHSPTEAVAEARAVYADVWTSMGHEAEAERRRQAFREYQVNEALFALAAPDAVFMHCLPARRDEEVTEAVIESDRAVVFDQAENRLHTQKALLLMLLD
jgi:ornithine carbamoyltransferase